MLNGLNVGLRKRTLQHIDLGRAHCGALALADKLHALGGRIGALVKLTRQELDSKNCCIARIGQLVGGNVYLRLREHGGHAGAEKLLVDTFDIVAVNNAQTAQLAHAEDVAQLAFELLGFHIEPGLLLHINARDH